MVLTKNQIRLRFISWKIVCWAFLRKEELLFVFNNRIMYVALLISSFFIYAEGVFFHAFFFNHYSASSSFSAVIQAFSSLDTYLYIILLYFLLAFCYWAMTLRNKIIIGEIVCDDNFKKKYSTAPLQNLLAYELFYIDNLSRQVDNKRPISTTIPIESKLNVTASVDFDPDFYNNLVTSESQIKLGNYIQIPINVIIAFFGRFFENKKIQGNALFTENEIIIIVSLTGDKHPRIWEVRRRYSPEKPDARDEKPDVHPEKEKDRKAAYGDEKDRNNTCGQSPDSSLEEIIKDMMQELAYRIFTDLTQFASFRWEATKFFMAGLDNYRSCLVTPRDQLIKLRNAEDDFIRAITEDSSFGMAWYNLGVVYTERGFFDAANDAFKKCISQEKNRWQAYYALALNANRQSRDSDTLLKAAEWCYHADELNKNIHKKNPNLKRYPEILRFKGQIYRSLYQNGPFWNKNRQDRKYFSRSCDAFEHATRLYYHQGVRPYALSHLKKTVLRAQELPSDLDEKKKLIDILGDFGWIFIIDAYVTEDQTARSSSLDIALAIFSEVIPYHKDLPQKSGIKESAFFEAIAQGLVSPCFLWKYGFLHMAKGDYCTANVLFREALAIKPQEFLFSISSNLSSLFCNPDITDAEMTAFWRDTIQFVKKPHDPLKGYVAETGEFLKPWHHIMHLWRVVPRFSSFYQDIQEPDSYFENPFSFLLTTSFFNEPEDSRIPGIKIFRKYILTLYSLFEINRLLSDSNFAREIITDHVQSLQSRDIEKSIIRDVIKKLREKEHAAIQVTEGPDNHGMTGEPGPKEDTVSEVMEESVIRNVIANLRNELSCSDKDIIDKLHNREKVAELRDGGFFGYDVQYIEELITREVISRLRENAPKEVPKDPKEVPKELVPDDMQLLGYLADQTDWIAGLVCCEIGKIFWDEGKNQQALDAYTKARNYLTAYPIELKKQSVVNVLAEFNKSLNHTDIALIQAWQAHWQNPTDESVHAQIGYCAGTVDDYRNAIKALNDARLWNPKFWAHSYVIAANYFTWIRDLRYDSRIDRATRKEFLQMAIDSLTESFYIAEEDFQKLKSDIEYEEYKKFLKGLLTQYAFLGLCYMANENYFEAIYYLRILKNLASTYDRDLEEDPEKLKQTVKETEIGRLLPTMINLSASLSKQGKYDLANNENYEILNTQSIKPIHEKIKKVHQDNFPPDVKEELKKECAIACGKDLNLVDFTIRDVLHETYLALARNNIECSCGHDNIKPWLTYAQRILEKVPLELPDSTPNKRLNIRNKKREYRGQIEKIEGLYHLKILHDTDQSIEHLRQSVCLYPNSEAFVFLLMALYQKLRYQKAEERDPKLLAEFNNHCFPLRKMGIPIEYHDSIISMHKELMQ